MTCDTRPLATVYDLSAFYEWGFALIPHPLPRPRLMAGPDGATVIAFPKEAIVRVLPQPGVRGWWEPNRPPISEWRGSPFVRPTRVEAKPLRHFLADHPSPLVGVRMSVCGSVREREAAFARSPRRTTCQRCLRALAMKILASRAAGHPPPWDATTEEAVLAKVKRLDRKRWARRVGRATR